MKFQNFIKQVQCTSSVVLKMSLFTAEFVAFRIASKRFVAKPINQNYSPDFIITASRVKVRVSPFISNKDRFNLANT